MAPRLGEEGQAQMAIRLWDRCNRG